MKEKIVFPDDSKKTPHFAGVGGFHWKYSFPNGYGGSVVSFPGSYGYERGLYELAVMKDGSVCYDTPLMDDVIGNLTPKEVQSYLNKIAALPPVEESGKK